MTSMTGYAYSEQIFENATISVEIKSVNSRFLDLSINIPPFLNQIESYFRTMIIQKVTRGKIDVFIRIREYESDSEVFADSNMAKSYVEAIKKIAQSIGFTSEIPLGLVINQPGVLNVEKKYDIENYKSMIEPVFVDSLNHFIEDRLREGQNMKNDLLEKLNVLQDCVSYFSDWQPKMESAFKEQIMSKFRDFFENNFDENRILTETAAMLVKYTINEEIVRLKSHISAMKNELETNETPGKRLDFICQEMNREINTIGSKNQFAEVSLVVVKAKDSLENIREQSKNVE